MPVEFSDEQRDLRRSVRTFLETKSPETEVRRLMETTSGHEPAVWAQMAEELGLVGLAIPEEFGGSGASYVELAIVLEEMGRALLCSPYFATVVMAASLLLTIGDQAAQRHHLPSIADGSRLATVALVEDSGSWDEAGIQTVATRSGLAWSLTGQKHYVLDGLIADLVLVAARTTRGVTLFAVDNVGHGLSREPVSTLDPTRKQATLTFRDCPAQLVGVEGQAWPAISHMLDLAAVALAAEMTGGADRVLEMAVDYAKTRIQFGRPIGSFQSIKHKCADMLLEVESARSAAYEGSRAAAQSDPDLPVLASLAKACCSSAFAFAASENIQIHDGIGFTWEHPAHLYYRRAKSGELLFGDVAYHRELLMARSGV